MPFRVNFEEVDTGIVLTENGEWALGTMPESPEFGTLEEARRYAEAKLEGIPHGAAWIGDDVDSGLEYVLSPDYPIYEREKRAFEFWRSLPFWRRWFTPRPSATKCNPHIGP